MCQNGGQCRNGECFCRDGFDGQFCEEEEEGVAAELIWFLIITLILLAAALLFWKGAQVKKFAMERMNRQREDETRAAERFDNG